LCIAGAKVNRVLRRLRYGAVGCRGAIRQRRPGHTQPG